MEDRWLTVDDIFKYLNVSNETTYKWIEQRGMPGHRVGRRWMFKQEEVDEWIRTDPTRRSILNGNLLAAVIGDRATLRD